LSSILDSASLRAAAVLLLSTALAGCEAPRRSSPVVERSSATSVAADSLLTAANALYDDGEYQSAAVLLRRAIERAAADGDSVTLARSLTKSGLAEYHLGNYSTAGSNLRAGLTLKERLGMKKELFTSYNALGLLAYTSGRYGDASEYFQRARAAADSVKDQWSAAKAVGNLGLVHTDIGRFADAQREYEFLFDAALSYHDTIPAGNALANLGMLSIRAGNSAGALQYLNRARALYASQNHPAGDEMVLGQLGSAYSDLGELQRALAYMDSARKIARTHGMRREEVEDLEIFAELYGDAGDHKTALKYLNQARAIADSVGLEARPGDIARAQARELAREGQYETALAHAREAASIHRKLSAPLGELEDRLLFAEIAQHLGHTADANAQLRLASQIATRLDLAVASEQLAIGSARVADIRGDATRVLRALPAELTFAHLGFAIAGEAAALRARAFARLGQWPEAINAGKGAIASLSRVRQRIGEGALRSAYVSDNSGVYADLVVALLHLGRTDEAFEIADEARGKALLEHLNSIEQSTRAASRDLVEADELLRRIAFLTQRLRLADTVPNPERTTSVKKDLLDLAARLDEARTEYESRINAVARLDPRGAAVIGARRADAREIQEVLRSDEMIVEYFVSANRLFIFAATRDTVVAQTRPIPIDDLANRVRLVSQQSAASRSIGEGMRARRALYDLLIAPIDSLSEATRALRLIVIPHSALTYLPFAALVDASGRNLIERRTILTLQSASALPFIRRTATFGDKSFSIFAPFPDELSGTLAEARLVKAEVTGPKGYIGHRATERRLRSALEREGNVHIASHAILNQSNPMFSHVELAPGRGSQPSDDGQLDVHELLRMHVKADLIYLSGCETGVGAAWSNSFRRNQDYATLSQALLFAGAQNVIATLWRIDDAGGSVFAQRFYRALRNHDVIDALAIAQRQMLLDARYAAPRYWAGYTASGSGLWSRVSQTPARVTVQ